MTYEEAFEYCRKNRFTIYFVPVGSVNAIHINTPRWFIERKSSLVDVVKELKVKFEREQVAETKLRKKLGHFPTYQEILDELGTSQFS
jgi:hypothetical protein